MGRRLRRLRKKALRACTHTQFSYLVYRYRYLSAFAVIGVLSVALEVVITARFMPARWPLPLRAGLAFTTGMLFSFAFNATANFKVPWRYLLQTFWRFALVSLFSFSLNMVAVFAFSQWIGGAYGQARFVSAGALFFVAYLLHRRFTFDHTRSFGIAIYASPSERVSRIFHRVGRTCDHLHVDLVDSTMLDGADPVDLSQLRRARRLWPTTPLCLHIMSLHPRRWVEQVWNEADWFLFHANAHDDLGRLIMACRLRGKRVGIVWHRNVDLGTILPHLAHVDFVTVLGIRQPGQSGQPLLDEAVAIAEMFDRLRGRYAYELIFDGGVNAQTIGRIPAKYIVAASAVLRAQSPIHSALLLKTGGIYESSAA